MNKSEALRIFTHMGCRTFADNFFASSLKVVHKRKNFFLSEGQEKKQGSPFFCLSKYNYKYQGQERQDELGLNWDSFKWRNYDYAIGRFMSVDPLVEQTGQAYIGMGNNPVNLVDPDGRAAVPPSTHIDENGNIITVINDGDNGVYQHMNNADGSTPTEYMIQKRQEVYESTSANGIKIGETEHWDEFVSPETDMPMTNYRIQVGKSFDPIISELSQKASGMGLVEIANKSRPGGIFDIKNDYPNVGGLLNGKYATSRSAGNYLAGYNSNNGGISFVTFQKLAGLVHQGQFSKVNAAKTVLTGYHVGEAPLFGEINYQYRMSVQGWSDRETTGNNKPVIIYPKGLKF